MPDSTSAPCMGWMPDLPSIKDYDTDSAAIKPLLAKLKGAGAKGAPAKLATSIDLRAWCSPIENQGSLGSCTANAGVNVEQSDGRAEVVLKLFAVLTQVVEGANEFTRVLQSDF